MVYPSIPAKAYLNLLRVTLIFQGWRWSWKASPCPRMSARQGGNPQDRQHKMIFFVAFTKYDKLAKNVIKSMVVKGKNHEKGIFFSPNHF
jgi:hypothetical protein